MDIKSLKRGSELEKEMQIIKSALASIKAAKIEPYWCVFCQHQDGSGWKADLRGANVAKEMADVVYAELQNQLALRKEEFEKL